jgi:hypothetical protein
MTNEINLQLQTIKEKNGWRIMKQRHDVLINQWNGTQFPWMKAKTITKLHWNQFSR